MDPFPNLGSRVGSRYHSGQGIQVLAVLFLHRDLRTTLYLAPDLRPICLEWLYQGQTAPNNIVPRIFRPPIPSTTVRWWFQDGILSYILPVIHIEQHFVYEKCYINYLLSLLFLFFFPQQGAQGGQGDAGVPGKPGPKGLPGKMVGTQKHNILYTYQYSNPWINLSCFLNLNVTSDGRFMFHPGGRRWDRTGWREGEYWTSYVTE